MIDMLKNFNDVCSSKMMIGNFSQMLSDGQKKIVEFFEKTQYSPLLMQNNTFIIHWPNTINSYTFASKSSIVSIESLEKELKSQYALRLRGGIIYTI